MSPTNDSVPKYRGRPKGTGAQRVYAGLRDDILHLRMLPGTNIDEATLEKRYDVSRTPVREALIRLASDGLISLLPNRGAQVSKIDVSDVPQFFEAMDVCQRMVLRLAAYRRSDEQIDELRALNAEFEGAATNHEVVAMTETNHRFHNAMALACGNKYLAGLYGELLSVGLRLARSAYGTAFDDSEVDESYFETVIDQHAAMIDALVARDADAADALGRDHTDLFRRRILRAIEHNPGREIDLAE